VDDILSFCFCNLFTVTRTNAPMCTTGRVSPSIMLLRERVEGAKNKKKRRLQKRRLLFWDKKNNTHIYTNKRGGKKIKCYRESLSAPEAVAGAGRPYAALEDAIDLTR